MSVQDQSQPVVAPFPTAAPELDAATRRGDCERLRLRIRELDEQHENDQQTIRELSQYRKSLNALVQKMFQDKDLTFTEEEVRDLLLGKDCLPLEAFLGDVNRKAKGL